MICVDACIQLIFDLLGVDGIYFEYPDEKFRNVMVQDMFL